jgi:hypothetical protein
MQSKFASLTSNVVIKTPFLFYQDHPGREKNVLVLEVLPYVFLLNNEAENTQNRSTLKTEYGSDKSRT